MLAFAGPHSFTGEDVAELHVHGGPAVVADVLEALAALPGLRLAAPGEFTRRAFENGKLDLTQVEALADLVNAETPWQRRQALRHMEGAARDLLERWRDRLKRVLAHVEAANDFAETDELDEGTRDDWAAAVRGLLEELQAHLASRRGEVIRHGIQVAIMGVPNAGKSSLLNRLGTWAPLDMGFLAYALSPRLSDFGGPGKDASGPPRGDRLAAGGHDARRYRGHGERRGLPARAGRHGGPARRPHDRRRRGDGGRAGRHCRGRGHPARRGADRERRPAPLCGCRPRPCGNGCPGRPSDARTRQRRHHRRAHQGRPRRD